MIRESFVSIELQLKEYDESVVVVVNGEEHHKPFLKFYLHPNSLHEERWILQKPETEEPKVFNIIRKPIVGKKAIEIEMDTLPGATPAVLSDLVTAVVPVTDPDWVATLILSRSRKEIAEQAATKMGHKSVEIAVRIEVVDLILSEEVMQVIQEEPEEGGMVPASLSALAKLRQSVEESSKTCPICLKGYLVGKSLMIRMQCSHEFHEKCIIKWLFHSNSCPMCRFQLPTRRIERYLWD